MQSSSNQKNQQRQILSDWRRGAAEVKERSELLKLLTCLLQRHFEFSGIFIQSVDRHSGTYYPFLIEHLSNARSLSEFKALSNTRAPVQDPLVRDALQHTGSFTVALEDLANDTHVPFWIRINFEYGVKEALVTPLKIKNDVVGISYIWSENLNSFDPEFIGIMDALSTDLGYAVSNTLVNDFSQREWLNDLLLAFCNDLAEVKTRADLHQAICKGMRHLMIFDEYLIAVLTPDAAADRIFSTSLDLDSAQRQWLNTNPLISDIFEYAQDPGLPSIIYAADLDKAGVPPCLGAGDGEKPGELLLKILPGAADPQFGLILTSHRNNHFYPPDRIIIQRISSHLTTAISNVQTNEELIRREKDKSLLLAFSHDIAAVRDKEDLRNAIEKTVSQLSSTARFVTTTRSSRAPRS